MLRSIIRSCAFRVLARTAAGTPVNDPEVRANRSEDVAAVSCASCEACCCRLEVMLMGDDDVPPALTEQDPWGGTVMRRLDDGWCAALNRNTMRCSIYERRPNLCRDYPEGGDDCRLERSTYFARILAPSPAKSG